MKMSVVIILSVALILLVVPIYAQESEVTIPSWIKAVAGAWSNDGITDSEYQQAMIFLIEQDIIQVNSSSSGSMAAQEKEILALQIDQKNDRIKILENDVKTIGLDNSKLLQGITDEQEKSASLQTSLTKSIEDFEKYKEDYPLKVGNIGGKLVNVDTIKQLEKQIKDLEAELEEYKN